MLKKILFLFIGVLLFTNCSNNEIANRDVNTLIGKWVLIEQYIDGTKQQINDCQKKSNYAFKENTADVYYYSKNCSSEKFLNMSYSIKNNILILSKDQDYLELKMKLYDNVLETITSNRKNIWQRVN